MILYLYRKWRQAVTLTSAVAMLSPMLAGQWGVPQRERKTPRAVGVLESDAEGERRLIPVTFFYERHYYDAGLYRATPVPFTLQPETVYEVQQFGRPLGTFTVQNATPNSTQRATAWFGNGHFKLMPDPAALARKKAAAPVVVEDPARPVLHRREGSEGDRPAAGAAAAKSGATGAEDDPDRPKLHRANGSGGDGAGSSPAPPAAAAAAKQAEAQAAASAASIAPQGEPDHPILRRGKPAQEQSGRDLPEFNSGSHPGPGPVGVVGQGPVVRQVAVSDAGAAEPQELIFACSPQQRQQMEDEARELAQAELRRMAPMRGLALPEAGEAAKTGAAQIGAGKTKTSAASKGKPDKAAASATAAASGTASSATASSGTPGALTLEDEQFVPYDLDYNDYATVVFSARYRPGAAGDGYAATDAAPAAGARGNASLPAAGAAAGAGWIVTVIARQNEDKLVKLYSAVSDPRELDLYPELRLVDAVDPDGYGRYALLFREQKRDGVSWLLGRVTGYELQTLFETAER